MTQAIALGNDGTVYSVQRSKGVSTIVAHTKKAARALYEVKDNLRALWVSPAGVIHAGGKRHHTNASGTWKTASTPAGDLMTLWGASETELFAGGLDGGIARYVDGAWTQIGEHSDMITCIHGTRASNVYIGGNGGFWHFDGTTLSPQQGTETNYVTGIFCADKDVWLSSHDGIHRNGRKIAGLPDGNHDELYGLAVGTSGVFALGPAVVYELSGSQLVEVDIPEKLLMVKRAEYSTAVVGDGTRAVAGGALTVLVNDGDGFVPWPAITPAAALKPAAKKPAPKQPAPKKPALKKSPKKR